MLPHDDDPSDTPLGTRTFVINSRGSENNETVNKVLASAIAGGVSGGAGGLLSKPWHPSLVHVADTF